MPKDEFKAASLEYYRSSYKVEKRRLEEADQEIKRLQEVLTKLETDYAALLQKQKAAATTISEDGYNPRWSWIDKIAFVILKKGQPMLSYEIIAELEAREPDKVRKRPDKEKFFSVVLSQAVKYERLMTQRRKGTRGSFYSVPLSDLQQ